MCPVPLVNRWPSLRTLTLSRTSVPIQPAVTPMMSILARSLTGWPTVTATPTLTCCTMITWVPARPCDLSLTGFDAVAGVALMPARYRPGAVPAGTVTRNGTACWLRGPTVTVGGRPVTQQPIARHGVASEP